MRRTGPLVMHIDRGADVGPFGEAHLDGVEHPFALGRRHVANAGS
ncbi:MAG TPA: hypothetical protein VK875_13515 [Euzebyales bacterium]|nr:hypothetical protein [Euzebyales bacterium]